MTLEQDPHGVALGCICKLFQHSLHAAKFLEQPVRKMSQVGSLPEIRPNHNRSSTQVSGCSSPGGLEHVLPGVVF